MEEAGARSVGKAAVETLTDQGLLAKVAMEGEDPAVGVTAVGRLTDQALLAKAAMEGKKVQVGEAAVGKLADQALLAKVAIGGKSSGVGEAAVCKLAGHNDVLAQIAASGRSAASSLAHKIIRVQLFLKEPSIEERLGITHLIVGRQPTSQGYINDRVFPNRYFTRYGEAVTFSVYSQKFTRDVKYATWSTDFPEATTESGYAHRRAREQVCCGTTGGFSKLRPGAVGG